jgi:hypothetical protein
VIAVFHVVGTVMEVFKTAHGSWIYPEPGLLKIAGVPLFSGFMYACIGSYIARIWRLMDFRFVRYPPIWTTWTLAVLAYLNFFTHHYGPDIRIGLFAASAALFGRTWVVFTPDRTPRRMPLLLGFGLVALFIWLAENLGTLAGAWAYPSQRHGWTMVSPAKLGAWYLLMLLRQLGGRAGDGGASARFSLARATGEQSLVGHPKRPPKRVGWLPVVIGTMRSVRVFWISLPTVGRDEPSRPRRASPFNLLRRRTVALPAIRFLLPQAQGGDPLGVFLPAGCFFGAATMMMRSSSMGSTASPASAPMLARKGLGRITPAEDLAHRGSHAPSPLERSYNIPWISRGPPAAQRAHFSLTASITAWSMRISWPHSRWVSGGSLSVASRPILLPRPLSGWRSRDSRWGCSRSP